MPLTKNSDETAFDHTGYTDTFLFQVCVFLRFDSRFSVLIRPMSEARKRILFLCVSSLFSPLPRRRLHQLFKLARKAGNCRKTHPIANFQNGQIRAKQQYTRRLKPYRLKVLQRRAFHNAPKDTAQMRGADMAQARQLLDRNVLHIM